MVFSVMRAWLIAAALCVASEGRTVVITGATGHTGSMVYLSLEKEGMTVRGLVRNATKAKSVLGCNACDESEGIFVGDITKQETMAAAMANADTLVITTGPAYHCKIPSVYIGCKFYPGADPKTIAWEGVKNQVRAFASSPGKPLSQRHVILLSNDLTTVPNNFLDKIDNSHGTFYALNGEAFTMSSGVPFTIIKPNGLNDGDAGTKEIVVAHDDQGWSALDLNYEFIHRSDVARLLAYASMNPDKVVGLRFDVTSKLIGGTPTSDVSRVFAKAKYPWDPRQQDQVVV
jgi:hypothetical protein